MRKGYMNRQSEIAPVNKGQGMTDLEIELLTAVKKANWHLADLYTGKRFSDDFREKYLEPLIAKAYAVAEARAKAGQG